jgi:predicted ATPase
MSSADDSTVHGGTEIRTPDQRVRVFVSSTLGELAREREAVRQAIDGLRLTPIMFETGARHHPARELYRAYLAQSDVFVGIYWQKYGWVAPGEEVSGLEDEYRLAGSLPKLIYVKAADAREPALEALLARLKADDMVSYKHFSTSAELTELLADDLAVLLTERFTRRGATPTVRSPSLPVPATELVGREVETVSAGRVLNDPAVHLVTVLGPGGIGKTRLAFELGRRWVAAGPDRSAWFADLSPVGDPARWIDALAGALGVRPEGSSPVFDLVVDRLQGRHTLIVLDNFEQVQAAAPEVARFLAACPDTTALVTSRRALRLRGEHEVQLAPLALPPADGPDFVERISQSAAVQLLVARAAAVRPGFVVTATNAVAVAELCRRLDGIPLALELAAAQLRVLSPAALLRRISGGLDRSIDLAAGPVDLPDRQRTLRATIEWSYSLLTEPERTLLARLSVFNGAWTLESAEAVATVNGSPDVLPTLTSLVGQSLVYADESDAEDLRFRMLGTIRAYAANALAERHESHDTSARLAHYVVDLVESVRDELQGPDNRQVAERVDRERDEIRSAIDWALQNDDAETVARLLTPLFSYWDSRGLLPMTHQLAEKAALLPSAASLSPYASALLSGARGMAMVIIGNAADAEPLMSRTLDAAVTLGDRRLQAFALFGLAVAVIHLSVGEAAGRLDRAADCYRESGDGWGLALTLSTRGQLAQLMGDPAAARSLHEMGLAAADAVDNDHLRAQIRDMLGLDAVTAGDLADARTQYGISAGLHIRLHDYEGSAYCLSGLAGLAIAQNRPAVAARLIGASAHARQIVGIAVWPGMQPVAQAQDAAVTAALGAASFLATAGEGGRMALADALEYGLAATNAESPSDPFAAWMPRLRAVETPGR